MNKTEVIAEVSRMTNISVSDCEKVLDAFEEVLGGELNRKGWKNGISEMIFKIMGKIKPGYQLDYTGYTGSGTELYIFATTPPSKLYY